MTIKRFDRTKFSRAGKKAAARRGLTLYYYGDGKGKTTAAIGTAVRARGAGMKVCVIQFMKSEKWQSYERQALKKLGIPVDVLGSGFVGIIDDRHPLRWHRLKAKQALQYAIQTLRSKKIDVVVADEAVTAVEEGLLTVRDILRLIKARRPSAHLILTGHAKYPAIIKACDLVTEMRNVKHPYYTRGTLAQRGIDF